jgi:glutamyl-tRNA reductase
MTGAVSVSYAAVELASKIFDDLETKKIVLLGAGDTAELTLKILAERGATNVTIANRTRANADELSKKIGVGKVVDFGAFGETMHDADVVIASVMVHQPLITKETVAQALRSRTKLTPLFIVDIGVPRNVDPAVKDLNNVFLHDIDSLSVIVEKNMMRRRSEIPKAEAIIDQEANAMFAWLNTQEAVPTIKALRELFERIRAAELEKFRHRFSDEQFALLEQMTHRMMQRLLHAPTVNLKQLVIDSNAPLTHEELIRYLFNLDSLTAGWAESENAGDMLNDEPKSE